MAAAGTAVGDLSTFSIAALPGLPKGRFNVSHAQLYHLFQHITQVAARLETPSAMHLNVGAYSNAIPMLTWLTQAELRTVIYGVPNVPLPSDRRLTPRALNQGVPLSREWFAIVYCDQWQILLHALPTANSQFACLLTQRLDVIDAAMSALGADNKLTARAAQLTRTRDEATVRLLWRFVDTLPDANQIVAGLGPLAVPYGLAMVLINREKDRWALMTQAVMRIISQTSLVMFRLDARTGMLQSFESNRPIPAVSLQSNQLISRAVLGDIPLFGQENGAAVTAMPVAIIGRVWGVAEFTRPQPFTVSDQMQIGLLTALIGVTLTELGDTPPNQQSVLDSAPSAPTSLPPPSLTNSFKAATPKAFSGTSARIEPEHITQTAPVVSPRAAPAATSIRLPSKLAVAEIPAMDNEIHLANANEPDELDNFSDFSFSSGSDDVYWPDLDDFLRADDMNETLIAQHISNGSDLPDVSRPLGIDLDMDMARPVSIEPLPIPPLMPPTPLIPPTPPVQSILPAPSAISDGERLALELLKAPAYPSQGARSWSEPAAEYIAPNTALSDFDQLAELEPAADLAAGFTPVSFTSAPIMPEDQNIEAFRPINLTNQLTAPSAASDVLDPFLSIAPDANVSMLSDTKDFNTANFAPDGFALDLTNDPFFVPPESELGGQTKQYADPLPEAPTGFAASFEPPFNLVDATRPVAAGSSWQSDFTNDMATLPNVEPLPIIAPLPDTMAPITEPAALPIAPDEPAAWTSATTAVEPTAPMADQDAFFAALQAPAESPLSTNIPVTTSALAIPAPMPPPTPAPTAFNRLPVSPMLNDLRLFLSRLRERVSRLPQVKSGFNATQTHLVAQVVSDVNSAIDALGDMALVADLNERLNRDAAWQRVDFGAVLQSLYAELKETAARRGLRLDWKPSQETFYMRGSDELLAQCGRALIGGLLELTTTGTVYIRLTRANQSLNLTVTVPRSEALPKQSSAILPGFDQLNPKRNRLAVAKAILAYHNGELTITANTTTTLDFTASLPLEPK